MHNMCANLLGSFLGNEVPQIHPRNLQYDHQHSANTAEPAV